MKIGVLGTGTVGRTIASSLVSGGNEVMMGSRTSSHPKATAWAAEAGSHASHGTFADAAAHGEIVFNCTAGTASVQAVQAAGADNLAGKILIDLANPLDFSKGMPPTLTVCNTDSLGEQIQRALPQTHVVKTLNTITNAVMVDPSLVPGDHQIFVSGDHADARATVVRLLGEWFGWKKENVLDLGGIETARGVEMFLAFWIRAMTALGTPYFNSRIVIGHGPAN